MNLMSAVTVPGNISRSISPGVSGMFLTTSIVVAGLAVLFALFELARRKSALLLLCIVGSIPCNFIEPIWDALGNLRFHAGNYWAFSMFPDLRTPVQYPWWAVFVYVFFAGVSCYVFYRMFENNPKPATFWWFVLGQAVMNVVLEGVIITGAYDYYGYQPWRYLTDFPLWWVFANYGELLGAALLVLAVRQWGRRAYPLAILLVPCSFGAWELWAGWPVYSAINAGAGPLLQNLAALLTASIAVVSIWLIRRIVLVSGGGSAVLTADRQNTVEEKAIG